MQTDTHAMDTDIPIVTSIGNSTTYPIPATINAVAIPPTAIIFACLFFLGNVQKSVSSRKKSNKLI